MITGLDAVCVIGIIIMGFLYGLKDMEYDLKNKEYQELKKTCELLRIQNFYLQKDNSTIQLKYKELLKDFNKKPQALKSSTSIPEGTISAVKYAMKMSHPDNGGKEKDFILFRQVYKELTHNKK